MILRLWALRVQVAVTRLGSRAAACGGLSVVLCGCRVPSAENNVDVQHAKGAVHAGRDGGGAQAASPGAGGGGNLLPSESDERLPATMKGYELYAWDEGGQLSFTLITGTNRQKFLAEVATKNANVHDGEWVVMGGSGEERLLRVLSAVPHETSIFLRELPGLPPCSDATRSVVKSAIASSGH